MKNLGYVLGALLGLVVLVAALVFGIGYLLPEEGAITRSVVISKPPSAVWPVLRDVAGQTAWRPQLRSIERLPDEGGHETWRVTDQHGESMTMLVMNSTPPQRLISRFRDPQASGDITWEFEIATLANDSRVTLTQRTQFSKPLDRFLSRFVFGARFADDYLTALARKFGDPPVVE